MSIYIGNKKVSGLIRGEDISHATETHAGIIEIATQNEVNEGTEDSKAITPQKAKNIYGGKVQIDFDGSTFKVGSKQLNFKDIHDMLLDSKDFVFVLFNNRAYLCSYLEDSSGVMQEIRFESTINAEGKTKVSSIYLVSTDGVNIINTTVTDINSENQGNKVIVIDEDDKYDTVKYPSANAVTRAIEAKQPYFIDYGNESVIAQNVIETALTGIIVGVVDSGTNSFYWMSHVDMQTYDLIFYNENAKVKLNLLTNNWSREYNPVKVDILEGNEQSTDKYPSVKAVADVTAELKEEIANKATNPENPVVGQWGRVKQIDGDGNLVWETTDLPLASDSVTGVVKSSRRYGIGATADGTLYGVSKSKEEYAGSPDALFVTKGTLNNILSAPSVMPELTAEEQAAARARIGVGGGGGYDDTEIKAEISEISEDVSSVKADLAEIIFEKNNLLDVDASVFGELNNSGTVNASTTYKVTPFIPVDENQTYTVHGYDKTLRIAFYQEENKPVSPSTSDWNAGRSVESYIAVVDWITINDDGTFTFTIPYGYKDRQGRNINLFRFTYFASNEENAGIVAGGKETPFVTGMAIKAAVPYIDQQLADIYRTVDRNSNIVDCGFDSLTAGVGGFTPYPELLQQKIGSDYNVINWGGGGNSAVDSAAIVGAMPAVIYPCTIADSASYTDNIPLKAYNGADLKQFGLKWTGINEGVTDKKAMIGKREVIISYSSSTGFRIRPANRGNGDIVVDRPTVIKTVYMQRDNIKDNILIMLIGANDGNITTSNQLIVLNKAIASKYRRYIVIGETVVVQDREAYEREMYNTFGVNFLNVRKYMVDFGLADAGITPTSADTQAISEGKLPPSLMYDSVHFNQAGLNVLADLIHKKGVELGYW